MSQISAIEWTDATWNPWHGCHKISPGCKNCYMFRDKKRYGQNPDVVVRSKTLFDAPLKWKEPRLIFTCSWSDWFIEEADAWREEAWDIIRRTPQHTYQILTKRADRMEGRVPNPPLPNVWLGVSVENQRYADERIPLLLKTPAAVRFLSVEPLLGPVDLYRFMPWTDIRDRHFNTGIDWVIAGGESGPEARPMHPDWVRSIRDQCVEAGVPFFFKQWGEWRDRRTGDPDAWNKQIRLTAGGRNGQDLAKADDGNEVWMQKVGKKEAGRLLDGRTWDEMPRTASTLAPSETPDLSGGLQVNPGRIASVLGPNP